MLINKLRSSADFKKLKDIPSEYFDNLTQNTPEYLLNLISKIVEVFLYRLNIPREEVEQFTDQIGRREFSMMFDSFEAYDVQETRRISKAEGKIEGEALKVITLTLKKLAKSYSVSEIADMLEEDETLIQCISDIKKCIRTAMKKKSGSCFARNRKKPETYGKAIFSCLICGKY